MIIIIGQHFDPEVERRKQRSKVIDINMLGEIKMYNAVIGGVDMMDMFVNQYSINI